MWPQLQSEKKVFPFAFLYEIGKTVLKAVHFTGVLNNYTPKLKPINEL